MKLISLHLPKTGGQSFRAALREYFGSALLEDYSDSALNKHPSERYKDVLLDSVIIGDEGLGNIECVHGHFFPLKYLLLSARERLRFVTWMRDPIDRLISHYHYWRRVYGEHVIDPRWKKVIEENWSLEEFCLCPEMRNLYCQYLWGFPLRAFDFIGITEYFEEELEYFSSIFLSGSLKLCHENVTRGARVVLPQKFCDKVRAYHREDMLLYERALELHSERVETLRK